MIQWRKAFTPLKTDFIIENNKLRDLKIQKLQQQIIATRRMHLIHLNNIARQTNLRVNHLPSENRRLTIKVQELTTFVECPVCYAATKNAVIICGHACCRNCLDKVDTCPVCRKIFNAIFELYL